MTDQNMFSGNTPDTQTQQNSGDPAPSSNPFTDKLSAIKNEKGEPKYKDVESALEALQHSQTFIETLKQEKQAEAERIRELETELAKRKSVDEAVERLMGNKGKSEDDRQTSQSLDAKAIEELIQSTLSRQKQGEMAERNLNEVVSKLSEMYGSEAQRVIAKRAVELNTTPQELEKLSRSNPSMALHLLSGVEIKKDPAAIKTSTSTQTQSVNKDTTLEKKSFTRGGFSNDELVSAWKQVEQHTNARLGVE